MKLVLILDIGFDRSSVSLFINKGFSFCSNVLKVDCLTAHRLVTSIVLQRSSEFSFMSTSFTVNRSISRTADICPMRVNSKESRLFFYLSVEQVFARKSKVVAREVETNGRKAAASRGGSETGIILTVFSCDGGIHLYARMRIIGKFPNFPFPKCVHFPFCCSSWEATQ